MKQIILLSFMMLIFGHQLWAQIINPKETAKRKVEDRANTRSDQGIDRGLDKIEEGIKGIFKKKDKKKKSQQDSSNNPDLSQSEDDVATDTTVDPANNSMKAYSKFDFIPGEKLLAYEDFKQDAVGDFPAQWNTNAGGEIVTIEGAPGHWLKVPRQGVFFPEFINGLPENVTIEFDMLIDMEQMSNNQSGLMLVLPKKLENRLTYDQLFSSETAVAFDIHPSGSEGYLYSYVSAIDLQQQPIIKNEANKPGFWNAGAINRISVWRQGTRIRLYVNEKKVWDLPKVFLPGVEYGFLFGTYMFGDGLFISNLRIAAGQPDTRSALVSKGRFSTTGILFETNSDQLNPASFGILKEIATTLKENPSVQVQIVGHTDSDGDEKANQLLSERRAKSVATALVNEFGIEASRLQTTGKGESDPVAPNDNSQNKAQNRRVEFINLTGTR
ncbi:MAG: OmpA family protein [Chitinophagaceae bacterium]